MSTIWLRAEEFTWLFSGIFDPNAKLKPALLRKVATIVAADVPLKMKAIHTAIAQRDGEMLSAKAHSLRGVLSMLVQSQDLSPLHELELMGKENDLDGAAQLYEDFRFKTNILVENIEESILRTRGLVS